MGRDFAKNDPLKTIFGYRYQHYLLNALEKDQVWLKLLWLILFYLADNPKIYLKYIYRKFYFERKSSLHRDCMIFNNLLSLFNLTAFN